jgi:hypothetical protein
MAVVFGAALIATWGFTSLVLDADVIGEPDAGPLLGPAMAAGSILTTWAWLTRLRGDAGSWMIAVLAAASSWFVMLAVGSIGYAVTRGEVAWILLFAGRYAPSPFLLLPAALAAVVVVVTKVIAGRSPQARSFDRR